jgi:hypothetical protein
VAHSCPCPVWSVLLLFLFLIGCERREETPVTDADIELMKDVGTAGPDLERRLLNSVSVQDGLVIVRAPSPGDTYVLPDNSPWSITCGGEGVSVTLVLRYPETTRMSGMTCSWSLL